MKNIAVRWWQLCSYFLLGIPLCWWFRVKTAGLMEPLPQGKAFIIVANHPQRLDPFLISYSLPWTQAKMLYPIRFVTAPRYLQSWMHKAVLLPFGCVSTTPRRGRKATAEFIHLLEKGETIFIFPQGMLVQRETPPPANNPHGTRPPPKVGAVYLEREVPRAVILPIHISYHNLYHNSNSENLGWGSILSRRITVAIEFKTLFRHGHFPKDLQPLADELQRITDGKG